MRVCVVAEYYPRPGHPGLGIWAHRQALAVRDEGTDVRVLALERPLPPLGALASVVPGKGRPATAPLREWLRDVRSQPEHATLDGVAVRYVRFVSPPRPVSYGSWGRWAAPTLGRALGALRESWPFELVHSHYAVPAGEAARRWMKRSSTALPLVVSVHGGDLTFAARQSKAGRRAVAGTLSAAAAVIANSSLTRGWIEELIGEREGLHVVHAGADLVYAEERHAQPTVATVAHLEPHKRQEDVIRALAGLGDRHPHLRYLVIGRGKDRSRLESLARSLGVEERVRFTGALPHEAALRELARCHVHAMPSSLDAFGVAHIEAMAAGLPSIAGAGTGAEDIARAGEGLLLVPPGDAVALAGTLDRLLSDRQELERLGSAARTTAERAFSWKRCGERTLEVYREALARSR